jgi:hypothetical protein
MWVATGVLDAALFDLLTAHTGDVAAETVQRTLIPPATSTRSAQQRLQTLRRRLEGVPLDLADLLHGPPPPGPQSHPLLLRQDWAEFERARPDLMAAARPLLIEWAVAPRVPGLFAQQLAALHDAARGDRRERSRHELFRALAERHPVLLDRHAAHIAVLLSGLEQLPVIEGLFTHQLASPHDGPLAQRRLLDRFRPTKINTEPGLVVGAAPGTPGPGVQLMIYSRTGRDLRDLHPSSAEQPSVMFLPDSRFGVVDRYPLDTAAGIWRVLLVDLSSTAPMTAAARDTVVAELTSSTRLSEEAARKKLANAERSWPTARDRGGFLAAAPLSLVAGGNGIAE